ncbi:MAG: DsbA family oxidoreductase [Pseudomonadota bacterium]
MKIDFVSDVACPWCAVGLNALEKALDNIGPSLPVEMHFRPFELNPQMPPEGEDVREHLARKYGLPPQQLERNRQALRERGAAVGFHFGERHRIWNTFDAHRLLHWAGLNGKQRELKHALLQAYHGEGENPGDHAVLLRLAGEVGLDVGEARSLLASGRYADEVRADEQRWLQLGIHSVPSVIIDGQHLIQGGQPPEVFERALRQLAGLPAPAP